MKDKTLRQMIEEVNQLLEENMNKEVISLGYQKYDQKNGRKVISEYDLKNILTEYVDDIRANITIDRGTDLSLLGFKIKLKRKKSEITNSYSHTNALTYAKLELFECYNDLLDKTLETIASDYKAKLKSEAEAEEKREAGQQADFFNHLKEAGIDFETFKKLKSEWSNLPFSLRYRLGDK